jgi:heme oxygenase
MSAMPAPHRSADPWIGAARSTDILQRLKHATRERNAALERRLPLLDPLLSHDAYRQLLGRFFGFYAPLELSLFGSSAWPEIGPSYCERRKAPRLALDLIALGTAPDALATLPHCRELPDVTSGARLFGCLYVIEGATWGGQIVTRHLHAQLGLTPQHGALFFSGYGAQTGSRWKAFGAQLTAFAQRSGGEDDDEIIAAANQAFATISAWLLPKPHAARAMA